MVHVIWLGWVDWLVVDRVLDRGHQQTEFLFERQSFLQIVY